MVKNFTLILFFSVSTWGLIISAVLFFIDNKGLATQGLQVSVVLLAITALLYFLANRNSRRLVREED